MHQLPSCNCSDFQGLEWGWCGDGLHQIKANLLFKVCLSLGELWWEVYFHKSLSTEAFF